MHKLIGLRTDVASVGSRSILYFFMEAFSCRRRQVHSVVRSWDAGIGVIDPAEHLKKTRTSVRSSLEGIAVFLKTDPVCTPPARAPQLEKSSKSSQSSLLTLRTCSTGRVIFRTFRPTATTSSH